MADNQKPPRKSNAGRPPLPEEEKKHYKQPGLSLRPDQITSLQNLSEILNITSRSGVNFGKASWRTLIALIAGAVTAEIIKSIRAWKESGISSPYAIVITPELTLLLTPSQPEPQATEPDPEAAKEGIKAEFAAPRKIPIVREGDLPPTESLQPAEE